MAPGNVTVVGAGVAGLACARELAAREVPVTVLERAPAIGGRCATLNHDGVAADFGCVFLHARTAEFGRALNALERDDKLFGWPVRVRQPQLAGFPDALRPGRRRMARRDGVQAFPDALARGLDVRTGAAVTALAAEGGHIVARGAEGAAHTAAAVVLAAALPDSVALAAPLVRDWPGGRAAIERLAAVPGVPTLTVIACYPERGEPLEFDLWYPLETTLLHALSNESGKRSAAGRRVLVLQARPAFSAEHLDDDPARWMPELLWEAAELLGRWAARPTWARPHVWPFARVRARHQLAEPVVLRAPAGGELVFAGDAFGPESGLEAAYLSGLAMGERLAARMIDRPRRHARASQVRDTAHRGGVPDPASS